MPQKSTKIYQKRNFPYEKCLIPIKYLDYKQFTKLAIAGIRKNLKKKIVGLRRTGTKIEKKISRGKFFFFHFPS